MHNSIVMCVFDPLTAGAFGQTWGKARSRGRPHIVAFGQEFDV
jgi:hypothetical protein